MNTRWYESNTGNHQGLIIEEETGRNIAVTYEKENARLVASAPELLRALQAIVNFNEADPDLYDGDDDGTLGRIMYAARTAIENATRKEGLS